MSIELKDICVHGHDRWNEGCEMCNALNQLGYRNVTLTKYELEDFNLTEQEMIKKYGVENDFKGEY